MWEGRAIHDEEAGGAQAGLFGGGGNDGAPAEASAGETATGQTPTPEPTVITEYIYIDQTVTPEASGGSSQGSDGEAVDGSGQVSGNSGGSGSEVEHDSDDDDHEDEHEEDDD